jgi:putative ABC transport system permease protein
LGITIGITALVALLLLGSGLEREIRKQANFLGANLLVTPKGWCAYEQISVLTGEQLPEAIPVDDVENISKIEGLITVPYLIERSAIDNNPVPVIGIQCAEMKDFKGWEVEIGEYITDKDTNGTVVGSGLAEQFALSVGDLLRIRGQEFTVKGILSEKGGNDDLSVFIPLEVAQDIYNIDEMVSFIAVRVDDITRIDEYTLEIEERANVEVISDGQLLNSVLSITGSVETTLRLIAAVAVLAAGFGIANTMMMAVYERRREIGILKAIGGKNTSIFRLFLFESISYGILGGILGLVIGFIIFFTASPYITQNEFTAFFNSSNDVGLSRIAVVGVVSGYLGHIRVLPRLQGIKAHTRGGHKP